MYPRIRTVFVILDVGFYASLLVDGEYIAVACVIVEWVSINIVGWFLGC
jgi:hypothetical protein